MTVPLSELRPVAPAPKAQPSPTRAPRGGAPTIRSRLVRIALAAVLPSLALAGLSLWQQHGAEAQRAERALVAQAHAVALLLDAEFAAGEGVLRALAESRALATGDLDGFAAEMRATAGAIGARALNLVAADGAILLSTARAAPTDRHIVRTGPAVQALATGRTAIGGLYLSPTVGEWSVGIGLPVLRPEGEGDALRVSHVLGLILSRERLLSALTRQRLAEGTVATVLDQAGLVAASLPAPAVETGSPAPPALREAMASGSGILRLPAADGTRVTAFARAPQSGYWVTLGLPERVFDAPLRAALLTTLLPGVGLMAGSVLLAVLLAGRLSRSLRRLGEAGAPATDHVVREVGELADALDRHAADRERVVAELRALFAHSPVGVARADAGGRVQDANDAFLRILGLTRAELAAGQVRWDDLTPPEWIGRDEAAIAEAMQLGSCAPYQKEYIRPDGTRVPVLTFFALHDREAGAASAFLVDLSGWGATEAALVRAHEQMRLGMQAARMYFWDWDVLTGAITWSDGLEAALGLPKGGFDGTIEAFRDLIHPDDQPRVEGAISGALAGLADYDIEFRMRRADGTPRSVVARATVMRDGTGRPVRMIGVDFDITDRRAAEDLLAEREAMLRFALDAGGLGAWSYDVVADLPHWDARTREIFGIGPDEALDYARVVGSLVHPEDRARVHAAAQAAFDPRGPGGYEIEHRVVLPDGALRWVSVRGRTSFGGEGAARRAIRLTGTARDVTAQMEAAAALAAAEERLRLAVDSAELGILSWDLRSGRLLLSARCRALYGLAPEEEAGTGRLLAAIHPEDRAATEAAIRRATEARADIRLDHRVVLEGGGERWLRLRGRVELGTDGAAATLRCVAMDVGSEKRAEALLRDDNERLEARVTERTQALTLAAAELQAEMRRRETAQAGLLQAQKLEALGRLTGGVAHDFNNVLAAVMGSLRLISRRAGGNAAILELARNGERAAERAAALVRQLLAFARREELAPAPMDLAEALAHAEELLRRAVGTGVAVSVRAEPGLWPVLADAHLLQVALLNLAVNARDAMGGSGALSLSIRNAPAEDARERPAGLRAGAEFVVVALSDTGPGMPPDVLARATEPFFTTKPRGEGTGLGLAMVHGFAQQSGGALHIRSAPGEGTTAELWLLRAAGPPAARDAADAISDPALHGDATILVVDDDDAVRLVTAGELRELGYHVIEANGAEAGLVQALAAPRLDLVVSDIVMPGRDGPWLAARLRAQRPRVPLIFVTGFAEHRDALRSEAVLRKPFTRQELGRCVLAALGRLPPPDRLLARLRHPALQEAYRAWRRLHDSGDAGLPHTAALDPALLDGLAESFLVAVEQDGAGRPAFRYIHAGAALSARLGRDLAGGVVQPEEDQLVDGLAEAYQRCARAAVPCHDYANFNLGDGAVLRFERLLLPLAEDGGTMPTHLLGVAIITGETEE